MVEVRGGPRWAWGLGGTAAVLVALAGNQTVCAAEFEGLIGDVNKDWVERIPDFPAAPTRDTPFLAITPLTSSEFDYSIDANSVSLGDDGVLRFTLAALSHAGARNVRYEGVRCATGEGKIYAYGNGNGGWSKAGNPSWQPLAGTPGFKAEQALARDYFCEDSVVLDMKTIWTRLKAKPGSRTIPF